MSLLLRIARSKGLLPRMSETEREALEAGTVWVDGELFSGKPDFRRMLREPYPALAAGVIDLQEAALVREAAEARRDAIRVDSFTLEEYLGITESFPAARVAATA